MSIIEELGMSQEELRELVIKRCADQLLDSGQDHDILETRLMDECKKASQQAANTTIAWLFDKHVKPKIEAQIDAAMLQASNEWGEAAGEPVTFTQYIVARAEKHMTEKVNHQGLSRAESRDSYGSFKGSQTRIGYMIDSHLQYHIGNAMKKIMADANNTLVEGIQKAVEAQLDKIKVRLETRVSS